MSISNNEKQYLISDDRLRIIIDNAGVGIIVLDKNNNHITVNPTFCGITGFEKKDLIEKPSPAPYWPKAFIKELSDLIDQLRKNQYIRVESYFKRKDGTIFPVRIIGSIIQDKNYNNEAILIIEDITKTKRTESELQLTQMMLLSINKDLERKIKERTDEVQRLLKQKDEFINQLGHDLKNPLSPLINLLPILEKQDLNPQSREILDVLNRNVQHMKNLIVKTIELARLNSPNIRFNFERLSLYEQCEECFLKNKMQLQQNNVSIINNISKDIYIKADKLRLIELLDNIISNAVKYSPENSSISIDSYVSDSTCVISIKDTGIGMTKDQLEHAFDEFYKADESRHDFDSSGLGMPICKRIIEKHGGKIWAESEGLNKGTAINFTLPIWNDELKENEQDCLYQLKNITQIQ